MAKSNLKKVQEEFDTLLTDVWKLWNEAELPEDEKEEKGKDPFSGTYWIEFSGLDDQERENLREDIGWLKGVSVVTGWKILGPREWSPRDRWIR